MKNSLNLKLFLSVCLLLILIILTVILLNTTVLESFYKNQKEKNLIDIYNQASTYYSENNIDSTSDFFVELQKIDSTMNIEIVIADKDNNVVITSSNNFLKNGFLMPRPNDNNPREPKNPNNNDKENFDNQFQKALELLSNENPYIIKTFSDNKFNTDYATLYGLINNDYYIFLRTPIESIRESVQISNKFLILVGIVCIIISSIITYVVSKAFTKPILELNDIAQKMSNLDFSKKYDVITQDEIGTLGMSINKLSNNLEKTIQDLKEANIDLEKDVEEKSKLSEMRNQFISDVSHELKTPIALIQGYAEGLNDGIVTDEESKKYYVEVILDEANKMSNLTKDLLDLSRLEYGKEELVYQDFSINDLVKNTLKKNEVLFKEKNITSEYISDGTYLVKADSNRIEQVLTNYISNAIKNVSNENIIRCKIEDLKDENKVRVIVFNSGNKIKDEDMPRLWTRFYKVDSSRNRDAGGTGIGLSLVKAIMTQHHQKYGANNLDNGVEFWFELDKAK
ncbi:MAG: HAMP domain-containing protein [Clostridia bacterium]|nr:HAMP domain-containing protein [Clostridia bacterium]